MKKILLIVLCTVICFSGCVSQSEYDSLNVQLSELQGEVSEKEILISEKDAKIACEKCGISHPKEDRYIPLEPQIIREEYLQSPSSNLPFWMTREVTTEEILGAIIYD